MSKNSEFSNIIVTVSSVLIMVNNNYYNMQINNQHLKFFHCLKQGFPSLHKFENFLVSIIVIFHDLHLMLMECQEFFCKVVWNLKEQTLKMNLTSHFYLT